MPRVEVHDTFPPYSASFRRRFGIDPATLTRGTSLRDSYFVGGSADQMLQRLRTTRDGILVSKETITDYSLNLGDLLRLRVLDHAADRIRPDEPDVFPADPYATRSPTG